jgi:hypothetical protein
MSKPKIWTLPELLDRIWTLSRGKRTAVAVEDRGTVTNFGQSHAKVVKRVVTGWDEDYKPRTYELNKISAASAAGLYERIKHMRAEDERRVRIRREDTAAWREGYDKGLEIGSQDQADPLNPAYSSWKSGYDSGYISGKAAAKTVFRQATYDQAEARAKTEVLLRGNVLCSCTEWGAILDPECLVHGGKS